MEEHERSRVVSLLDRDAELRELWGEHVAFERRLAQLDELAHLTPDEEVERKRLQKLKLAGKTRIADILARHGKS